VAVGGGVGVEVGGGGRYSRCPAHNWYVLRQLYLTTSAILVPWLTASE
jgi:hypothetical protein